jgi:hypothetical protein
MEKLKATSVRLIKDKWDFFSNKMNVTSIQEGVDMLLEMFYYTFKDKDSFQLKKIDAEKLRKLLKSTEDPNLTTYFKDMKEV